MSVDETVILASISSTTIGSITAVAVVSGAFFGTMWAVIKKGASKNKRDGLQAAEEIAAYMGVPLQDVNPRRAKEVTEMFFPINGGEVPYVPIGKRHPLSEVHTRYHVGARPPDGSPESLRELLNLPEVRTYALRPNGHSNGQTQTADPVALE